MRKLIRLAAQLYPPDWRRRYGAEFEALLAANEADSEHRWRDLFDVLGGAIKMRISLWSFRNITAVCGLLGLIVAAGWAFSLPNRYVSRAVMRMEFPNSNDPGVQNRHISHLIQDVLTRSSLSSIIQRPDLDLYKRDRNREPLEDVIETMKKDIRVELRKTNSSATSFVVSFIYPDPVKAQKTTNILVAKLVDANFLASRNTNPRAIGTLSLLDRASLPQEPTVPNRWQIILAGLALGLVAGILILGVRRWPLVAVSGFGGLILGGAVSFVIPNVYTSHALLSVNSPQQLPGLTEKVLSDDSLRNVIEKLNLYPNQRRSHPIGEVIRDMRRRDLTIDAKATAIVISYRYTDRYKAQQVVRYVEEALLVAEPAHPLETLDRASFPETPSAPNRSLIAGVGMGFGVLAWVAIRHRGAAGRFPNLPERN